ncbi:MAG TPA: class I tRNA ligase family protein, partial [Myxococcus sp.]|nr:class I tRNA ligase family protein [Myxococcus sp.]
ARMMMMGLHFMGDVPFRTVYLHAMVRDEKGEKMSKTKGNVIDPLDIVLGQTADKLPPAMKNKFPQGMPAFGADALRFTLASLTQQGRDIKLSLDRVGGYKAFCNKLWNASRFALMNMGEFRLDERPLSQRSLTLADRWILSRLQRATTDTRAALEVYGFAEAASTLYQFLWAELCDWYIELAKGSLYGEDPAAKDTTRAVLVYCLDRILRLLHPFMPFITEEIWQKLPMSRPVDSIMIAPYPEPDAALLDEAAEGEMAPVIAAIEGLRTIRGESNLPPATKVKAVVQSPDARTRELLERWRGYLMPLAGLSEVTVGAPGAKPPQAAAYVGANLEIYVPLAGLVDLDAERERLKKEIARAEQEIAGMLRKLDNPNFVAKAPPDVVEKDRARVEELKERKAKLQDHLQRIAPEPPMPENTPSESNTQSPEESASPSAPAQVKVAPKQEDKGGVDLGQELKGEMGDSDGAPEAADPQVEDALARLREGTKEGLSPSDHHDLGVAYMSMGLVDDAMREFNRAKEGGDARESPVAQATGAAAPESTEPLKLHGDKLAVQPPAKDAARPATAKKPSKQASGTAATAPSKAPSAGAAKKAAGKKAPAKKAPAPAKKASAKKAAVKKGAAKKAVAKKAPAKKAAAKKGAAAKKAAGRKAPAKKASAKKAAAKKATRAKPTARAKARR